MMKVNSGSGDISVACSIMISDNRDTLGMVKDKSKYGLLTLTKNGLLQLQFVSKLVLSYNVSDLSSIFERFLDEGKATLRFKRASQDIMLQSKDTNGLKLFVKAVKALRTGKTPEPGKSHSGKSSTNENCPPIVTKGVEQSVSHIIVHKKNENGKRPALSASNQVQDDKPIIPPKRRQTIAGPALLKKSESMEGKVLRRLNESGNYLTALSCEKCRILSFARSHELTSLSSLDLIECGLSSVPKELVAIPHLTSLSLAHNNIVRLDAEVLSGASRLSILDLSFNRLTALPLSVINMKSVRSLLLRSNRIRILTVLPPSVVRVDLSQNPLNTIWVNKSTKLFGDVDISGLLPPLDETNSSFEDLRKVTDVIVFSRDVPSLFECASRCAVKHWVSLYWRHIPDVLVSQIEAECLCCVCNQLTITPGFVRRCALVHMGWRSQMTDSTSQSVNFLSVTCQVCASASSRRSCAVR